MKQIFKIVGMKHRPDAGATMKRLKTGDTLKLVRDPENQYDRCAVQVWALGEHIAYIDRKTNRPLADHMDNLGSSIDAILTHADRWPHAEVDI